MKLFRLARVPVAALALAAVSATSAEEAAPFGFSDLEIFRVSDESVALRVHDINGDGRSDVIYAHNTDTSVRLLIQRDEASRAKAEKEEISGTGRGEERFNELASDSRFETRKIYTEKKVLSLQIGDFDGDGRPDLVYYGDPRELVVNYQAGDWKKTEKFSIRDGLPARDGLAVADIDGDGRDDVALLGKGKIYLLEQRETGGLATPRVLYSASTGAGALEVFDLDGDGSRDLVLTSLRSEFPVSARFQRNGVFGSELRFKLIQCADAAFSDLDRDGRKELVAIQGNTRQVVVYRWGDRVDTGEKLALRDPRFIPYRPGASSSQRRTAFGDVDGDGRVDLLVSYGETAEVEVSLQLEGGDLGRPTASPVLSDVQGMAVGDFDGRKGSELLLVSSKERSLGLSRWMEVGRLSVPRTTSIEVDPIDLARFPLPEDGVFARSSASHDAFALLGKGTGSGSYTVQLLSYGDGETLRKHAEVTIASGAKPTGLRVLDLDGDGISDVLVFIPYEAPRIFATRRSEEGGKVVFEEISKRKDFGAGQLTNLAPPALTAVRFPRQGRETAPSGAEDLLVAAKSHARVLGLDSRGRLEIVEQFSGRGATANIQGAVSLDLDEDSDVEVILFDDTTKALDIMDRGERGVYEQIKSVPLPGFEFEGFQLADFDGDREDDLAVLGKTGLALLLRGREPRGFVESARFDSGDKALGDVKRYGQPASLVVGDLNADSVPDICFATQPEYYLTFLRAESGKVVAGRLVPSMRFRIFEHKAYMEGGEFYGPREMRVADMTGDAREDLLLLIHDRILLYVQE